MLSLTARPRVRLNAHRTITSPHHSIRKPRVALRVQSSDKTLASNDNKGLDATSELTTSDQLTDHFHDNVSLEMLSKGVESFGSVEEGLAILRKKDAEGMEISGKFYNRLMKAMNRAKRYHDALDLFERMKVRGAVTTEHPYATAISSCSQLKDIKMAQNYFSELRRTPGLEVSHYSYTAVIDACVRNGSFHRGMFYFEEMLLAGLKPKHAVYGALISGCRFTNVRPAQAAEKCTELLRDMHNRGLHPNCAVYGAAMSVYYAAGDIKNVMALYKLLKHQKKVDFIVYDVLFKLFANGAYPMSYVMDFYRDMQSIGISPSSYTFSLLLRCAMRAGEWKEAWMFIDEMTDRGYKPNLVNYNCLIGSYVQAAKFKKHDPNILEDCQIVLETIEEAGLKPDVFSFNQLVMLCLWLEDLDRGVAFFNEMRERGIELTTLCYTNLMQLHVKLGNPEDGLIYLEPCFQILNEMETNDLELDERVFTSLLTACARAKNADMVDGLLARIKKHNVAYSRYICNDLIRVWGAVGEQKRAMEMLETMRAENIRPNVVTFTLLLEQSVNSSATQDIIELIEIMQKVRVAPNDITRAVMEKLDMSIFRPPEMALIQSFLGRS